MLLRRVTEHLKKQEWTAVAIDFVIVVLGVFIGLQVANLNEARADRARAEGYLERIHADLEADLHNYRDRLDFWSEVSAYGRTGLDYADTGGAQQNSKWELLLAYFQASQVAEHFTTSTTYDELKSAGELGLIANVELRTALASYYTFAGNPLLSERPAYRVHVRGVIPLELQLYIWTNCYASTSDGEQEMHECSSPVSEARAGQVVDIIRRDTALMAELRYWMSTMHVATLIARGRAELATRVLASVDAELGGRLSGP